VQVFRNCAIVGFAHPAGELRSRAKIQMPTAISLKIHKMLLLGRSQPGIQIHSFVSIALSCSPVVQPNPLTKEWGQWNAVLNPEIIVTRLKLINR
jgi:hypothetical protein